MRRTNSVPATPSTPPPRPEPLPTPQRLPVDNDFTRTVPASVAHARATRPSLTVVVRNLPAELPRDRTGVAVAPATGPGESLWLPLASARSTVNGELELHTTLPGAADYVVAIAAEPFAARNGWLARATATVGQADTTLVLDAPAVAVTFQTAAGTRHSGPFWLRRRDVAEWQAPGAAAAGVAVRDGQPWSLWLGHGTYELRDPSHPDRSFAFTTPETTTISLSDVLATPRTDRP